MNKIRNFFAIIWYYITYPFYRKRDKRIEEKLRKIAEEDRETHINEKDIEFLKSIGVDYTKKK